MTNHSNHFGRQLLVMAAVLLGVTLLLIGLVPPQEAQSQEDEEKKTTTQSAQQQEEGEKTDTPAEGNEEEQNKWVLDKDPQGNEYVAGELLVSYKKGAFKKAKDETPKKVGGKVEKDFPEIEGQHVSVPEAKNEQAQEARQEALERKKKDLEQDPDVEAVGYNYVGYATMTPNDTQYGKQWAYPKINAPTGWDSTQGNNTVRVAILDSGIDSTHPDLLVAGGASCRSSNCVVETPPSDPFGHGTHIAGTVGALDNGVGVVGVAPGVRLWSVRVLDAQGNGELSAVLAGLEWVTGQAPTIEVANASFGCECVSSALDAAVDRLTAAGTSLVVAAGNAAQNAGGIAPANHPSVLAVSAFADYDGQPGASAPSSCSTERDDHFALFSNFGSVIDLAAPGVCIVSTVPGGYLAASGTSMAAPHVAGAAALYIVENGLAASPGRPGVVRSGLLQRWSAPQSSSCGFAGARSGEPLLHLTGCGAGGQQPANTAPDVAITAPADGAALPAGRPVRLTGSARDAEEGDLSGRISWSSDVDGALGSGGSVTATISPGAHSLTAEVVDRGGLTDTDRVTVNVEGQPPAAGPIGQACPEGRVPEDGFADVAAANPHEAAIDCAVWWQVARGTATRAFAPGVMVNRGQMASFIAALIPRSGGSLPAATRDRFRDDAGSPHEANINRLAEAGLVDGKSDGTYRPGEPVSRAQMATFLVRAYEYRSEAALPASADRFDDDAGNAHEDNINRAAAAGLTGGRAARAYDPDGEVTRAQMASFLARTLDLLVRQGFVTPPE